MKLEGPSLKPGGPNNDGDSSERGVESGGALLAAGRPTGSQLRRTQDFLTEEPFKCIKMRRPGDQNKQSLHRVIKLL